MKTYARHTILIAATVLVVACAKDSQPPRPLPPASEQAILLTVDGVDDPQDTRALVGNEPAGGETVDWVTLEHVCTPVANGGLGESIGVWGDYTYTDPVSGRERTEENIFANSVLTYDQTAGDNPHSFWNYSGDVRYWMHNSVYKFRAYYPQSLGEHVIPTSNATTFAIDQYNTLYNQKDILVAYNRVDTKTADLSQPVPLNFHHALAAVRFRFRLGFIDSDRLISFWLQKTDKTDFAALGSLIYGLSEEVDPDHPDESRADEFRWELAYAISENNRLFYWKHTGSGDGNDGMPIRTEQKKDGYGNPEFDTNGDPILDYVEIAQAYTHCNIPGHTTTGEEYLDNAGWLLVLPQESKGQVNICFTTLVGGENSIYRIALPARTGTDMSGNEKVDGTWFAPGKRYTYLITITESNIVLDLSVEDWNELNSSHQIVF